MPARSRTIIGRAFVALLAVAVVAAAPAAGSERVATDACGDITSERDVTLDAWQDLCSLDVAAVASGGGPTQLAVRLEMVSVDRQSPTALSIAWTDADGCVIRLMLGDATGTATPRQEAISAIGLDCDDPDAPFNDCATVIEVAVVRVGDCRQGYETVDIPGPTVDGNAYVWSIAVEGAVAELIGDLPVGTLLEQGYTTSSNRLYRLAPGGQGICFGLDDPGTCTYAGDGMASDAVVEVVGG